MPEEPFYRNTVSPEAVVNSTVEGVIVIDKTGIVQTFNPAAESLFDFQANEVIGKNISLLMPEPNRSEYDNYLKSYLQNRNSDFMGVLRELTALRKDGFLFPIEIAANPINLGTKRFFVVTIRDISERKEAEARRDLLHNITKIFSTSDDLEKVCPKVLQTICEFMGWDITFCWVLDKDKQILQCYESWHSSENKERFKEFVEKSYEIFFEKGKGLPGRIWKNGESHWIHNVVKDSNFPRSPFALKAGLMSGFGFPIVNSNELVGLIEVFSEKTIQPTEEYPFNAANG